LSLASHSLTLGARATARGIGCVPDELCFDGS
jgi:hypothetical protein